MKKMMIVLLSGVLASGAWADSCDEKAIGKNGKPLAGAAKEAFMKKCERENGMPAMNSDKDACESRAVDKNGNPLHGAAKGAFIKKCNSDQHDGHRGQMHEEKHREKHGEKQDDSHEHKRGK